MSNRYRSLRDGVTIMHAEPGTKIDAVFRRSKRWQRLPDAPAVVEAAEPDAYAETVAEAYAPELDEAVPDEPDGDEE